MCCQHHQLGRVDLVSNRPRPKWTIRRISRIGGRLSWTQAEIAKSVVPVCMAEKGQPQTGRRCIGGELHRADQEVQGSERTACVVSRQQRDVNRLPDPDLDLSAVASWSACDRADLIRPSISIKGDLWSSASTDELPTVGGTLTALGTAAIPATRSLVQWFREALPT